MQNQNIPSEKMAMNDKVVMITGANSGIGKAASLALAKMGARVVMVTRNKEKGEAAKSEIIRESQNGSVDLLLADLSSLESVRSLNRISEEIFQTSRPHQQRRTVQPETPCHDERLREYLRHKLSRAFPLDKPPTANPKGQRTQSNYQRLIRRTLQRTHQL